ncbi:cysteine-rich RLK (RECEPTOR-like protein kinase) 8 [Striga hermonthica]|uniref:Cysteine-rich RLK (RECEPTOR-like protein kinase) 8 n=1 Tax=Striga hermonthica TaxID=68872 RepID=A0A9N7R617_STRHE|nr:cysteine-rich RLK (RECEPTOR-like protein kinase) 8 [Striga hermonthica]
MLEIGYSRCNADHCCYVKKFGNSFIILLLYVDDMLIAGSDVKEIERLKDQLSKRFDMKDLGEARQILGMKITRDRNAGSDHDKRRSTTGYVFTYGGTAVSWISKLQKIVTLSTTEAEYVAVTEAAKELVWLQNFLNELGRPQEDLALYSDSQSAIHLAKNPAFHSRTKHIEVKYHFIRQLLEKKMLQLKKRAMASPWREARRGGALSPQTLEARRGSKRRRLGCSAT